MPQDAIDEFVDGTDQADIDLSAVTSRFDDLQRTVEAFETKLDTLSASALAADDGAIEEMAMDLLPRLPSYPGDIPEHALRHMGGTGDRSPREYIHFIVEASREDDEMKTIDGTAQRFARETREATPAVREALCYLESETTEDVESAVVDGKRHWMRGL